MIIELVKVIETIEIANDATKEEFEKILNLADETDTEVRIKEF
jgi:hypothetical protein